MRRCDWMLGAAVVVLLVTAGSGLCARSGKDGGTGDFEMYVAPNVLVINAPCPWVTVHTEVRYGDVDGVSVRVDDQSVDYDHTYADSRGNLVVKLRFDDVVADVTDETATIELELTLDVDGVDQVAAATVQVKQ